MLENWVKQDITVGGTGNITLGAASSAEYRVISKPVGSEVKGACVDGNDSEIAIYRVLPSSQLERVHIQETLASGIHNRLNPTPLDLSTSATFEIVADANAFIQSGHGLPYQNASGIVGRASYGQHDLAGTNISLSHFRRMFPFNRNRSGYVSSASVICATAIAGATGRIFAYQRKYDGSPGVLIGEFTLDGELDFSTTGIKTATLTQPILIGDPEIFISIQISAAGVFLEGNADAPSSWLGTTSAGGIIGNLFRTDAYANAGGDETGFTWNEDSSYVTTFLRDI